MNKKALLFLSLFLISDAFSSPFVVVTESIPPYQTQIEGVVAGTVTKIVRDTLKCSNLDADFLLLPWKRAYDIALENKNTLIYSMARTAEREDKFHWIGPVLQTSVNLYKLKARTDIQINKFSDIKNYHLGLLRGGFIVNVFTSKGFKLKTNFSLNDSNESRINMLFAERYDLIDTLDIQLDQLLSKTTHSRSEIELVMPLVNDETLYLAMNPSADPELVNNLKTCLKKFSPLSSL